MQLDHCFTFNGMLIFIFALNWSNYYY